VSTLDNANPETAGSTFRDYFENFLWDRSWVVEKTLHEIGFKLKPDGTVDGTRKLEDVKVEAGKYVKTKLPSGNRMVLLGTRLGAVALHEYWVDQARTKKNLAIITSDRIAHFRFVRQARTAEDQLQELLLVFGFPERGIKNLHDYLEELYGAVLETM
jgi:hypothetical protein